MSDAAPLPSAPSARSSARLSEAEWLQVMAEFLEGASDGACAVKWGVSNATVAAQRFKRGVYRHGRSAAPVRAQAAAAAEAVAEAGARAAAQAAAEEAARPPAPDFEPPESDDPAAGIDALLAHSRRLLAAGRLAEAGTVARLARLHGLALGVRRAALGEVGAGAGAGWAPAVEPVLRPAQTPPEGDWRTWLFLGGRGAGKTLAGAAWLAGRARVCGRLALVGPTYADVREVMIEGPSGLRGLAVGFGPEGGRPDYEPSRRRLSWRNGAVAQVFTAEEPDGLRGPQFEAAWADELCAWARLEETLAMLRMGLRLGVDPRLAVTTTPRPTAGLARLLGEAGLAVTRGSAVENAEHLAPGFVEGLRALYGGTRLERQEIDGEVLEALEGAVFRRAELERARTMGCDGRPGRFDSVVVAVDPPAGSTGAACGIVAAGRLGPVAWVVEDATVQGFSPLGWASRVAEVAERAGRLGPVRVVAEANQGGEMVRQVLENAGLRLPVRLVHAVVGKRARAEPVALLYEQGRVAHAPGLAALEDQMLLLGAGAGERGGASPDRADALVWALSVLMLRGGGESCGPRVSLL